VLAHFKNADLIGGAKPVLDRPQNAEPMTAFSFEIEHGVDHVLEHARSGDNPLLRDVAHEDQHETPPFG
jgi:hypothetical protein